MIPHYNLFLGHCQLIKQSFQQVDKGQVGSGRGREKTGAENRNLLHWPSTETFPITGAVTITHLEKSALGMGGHTHKEGTWHPIDHIIKAYLASLISVHLLNLAHCLWGLSRTTLITFLGKRPTGCGGTRPWAHACPLPGMSRCVSEGTKAALETLQAATHPLPSLWSRSLFPTAKLNVGKKLYSCLGMQTPGPKSDMKGELDIQNWNTPHLRGREGDN